MREKKDEKIRRKKMGGKAFSKREREKELDREREGESEREREINLTHSDTLTHSHNLFLRASNASVRPSVRPSVRQSCDEAKFRGRNFFPSSIKTWKRRAQETASLPVVVVATVAVA